MQLYIMRGGEQLGPFSSEEARQRLANGEFQLTDLAWAEGLAVWVPLSTLPGFAPVRPLEHPSISVPPVPPERVSPAVGQSPGPVPGATGRAVKSSGLAIASLVCGFFSFLLLPGIAAIICGYKARSMAKKSFGTIGGNGMALAGIIMGYAGAAAVLLGVVAALLLPVFAGAKANARDEQALNSGKLIGIACRMYAFDHDGAFPPNLQVLSPKYLPNPQIALGFDYFPGQHEDDSRENVIVFSKLMNRKNQRVVVHADGWVLLETGTPSAPVLRESPH
ncbi:MAG: GYF domain-containing protein [Chthoniobacter sp.]|nr:GYF domain-containing protein [Chthoniobacter sp.]